ncbi:hypothetical protein WOLCODRAFT_149942 [Wolfiporia cocos MD-104 SS10]|uniref:Uncharacterized protein n=1 Tax=Wolfiporia cocos (strain MD-104) TaxID=742152 RepID=A0A2H3JQ71_WOLCO|nr:hypothetical protein WOLCODRAFT_149942 [Wolfiporia cocos MD-104 SS10]
MQMRYGSFPRIENGVKRADKRAGASKKATGEGSVGRSGVERGRAWQRRVSPATTSRQSCAKSDGGTLGRENNTGGTWEKDNGESSQNLQAIPAALEGSLETGAAARAAGTAAGQVWERGRCWRRRGRSVAVAEGGEEVVVAEKGRGKICFPSSEQSPPPTRSVALPGLLMSARPPFRPSPPRSVRRDLPESMCSSCVTMQSWALHGAPVGGGTLRLPSLPPPCAPGRPCDNGCSPIVLSFISPSHLLFAKETLVGASQPSVTFRLRLRFQLHPRDTNSGRVHVRMGPRPVRAVSAAACSRDASPRTDAFQDASLICVAACVAALPRAGSATFNLCVRRHAQQFEIAAPAGGRAFPDSPPRQPMSNSKCEPKLARPSSVVPNRLRVRTDPHHGCAPLASAADPARCMRSHPPGDKSPSGQPTTTTLDIAGVGTAPQKPRPPCALRTPRLLRCYLRDATGIDDSPGGSHRQERAQAINQSGADRPSIARGMRLGTCHADDIVNSFIQDATEQPARGTGSSRKYLTRPLSVHGLGHHTCPPSVRLHMPHATCCVACRARSNVPPPPCNFPVALFSEPASTFARSSQAPVCCSPFSLRGDAARDHAPVCGAAAGLRGVRPWLAGLLRRPLR